MKKKSFYLVSLGCAKNTVDSDSMARLLLEDGYVFVDKPSQAEVLIVNTCGFIQPAVDESIETLQELADRKKPGQTLIAAGCLTQRFGDQVAREVSGLDGIMGTRRWMDILEVIKNIRQNNAPTPVYHIPDEATVVGSDEHGVMRATVQGGSAYLKIADGCRRPCAFCTIPLIKGTLVSRPVDLVIQQARSLQSMGVQEIILIAQDTTDYGHDLGLKDGLAHLLEKMLPEIPDVPWVRILYAYPGYVTERLIDVMAGHPQVLPYLDIPLQHAHPQVLKAMRRPVNIDWVNQTLAKMRSAMPDLALRTTFIVGYPGETETEFQSLLDFIGEIRFDRVGVFPYSFEHGAPGEALGDPVSGEEKAARLERLMLMQQDISLELNQQLVGKRLQMLVEGYNDGVTIGRTYRDAPEIDGLVFAEGRAPTGKIVNIQITGAMIHDLTGVILPD